MRNRRLLLPVSLSRVALAAGLVVAGVAAAPAANAQQLGGAFPFPSTNLEASRFKTDAITTYEVEDLYRKWVADTIRSCGNDVRVLYTENNPQDTRSEGIGYGMVIAAYMGDQATFEGLWSFYQRHSTQGLMNWLLNDCNMVGDGGSAADADIDAALGLIVADKQFPNQGYADDARTLLNAVRTRLVEPANRGGNCNGILLPGSNYSGCGCVNPSYIPPGYYAAYAAFDTANAAAWNNARNTSYTLLAAAQNDTTGFVPAWSTSTGSTQLQNCAFQVAGGGEPDEYQSDAARTPWRVATDYAWTGDPRAAQFLDVLNGFVSGLPRVRIIDRYSLEGQGLGNDVASAFGRRGSFHMGGFATAMIASNQENLDSFTGAWNSVYRAGDLINGATLRAYNGSLALLYALLVTGTMWSPTGPNPSDLQRADLPAAGANILDNGDFTAGLRGWTTQSLSNPAAGDDSDGYMLHKAGEIHARVLKIQAERAYGIQFYQDVALEAGLNYLVSLKARATAPRPIRLVIGEVEDFDNNGEQYEAYAVLRDGEADTFDVTTTDATYSFVFTQPVSNPGARLNLQFGDDMAEVIFDDVSVVPTTLPPTEVVGVEGGGPVTTPDPGTPGGTPTGTPGDGTIGTVDPVGDPGTSPGVSPGVPNPDNSTAGLPPPPTAVPGAGSCSAANPGVCAPALCSVELGLCYDDATGYVWDPSQNRYTQPPKGVLGCGPDQVYWPKYKLCYVPDTGWIFNPTATPPAWEFYGIDYEQGKYPPGEDSGCSVANVPGSHEGSKWLLVGLLGAALGLTYRRRTA